jgi:hypothetical protein
VWGGGKEGGERQTSRQTHLFVIPHPPRPPPHTPSRLGTQVETTASPPVAVNGGTRRAVIHFVRRANQRRTVRMPQTAIQPPPMAVRMPRRPRRVHQAQLAVWARRLNPREAVQSPTGPVANATRVSCTKRSGRRRPPPGSAGLLVSMAMATPQCRRPRSRTPATTRRPP